MGYSVLSGKIHVDKHDTTFFTFISWLNNRTLSFICIFTRLWGKQIYFQINILSKLKPSGTARLTRKCKLLFILWNRPPTIAAKWITCVGRCFSNSFLVSSKLLRKEDNIYIVIAIARINCINRIVYYVKSASLEPTKIHVSSLAFSALTIVSIDLPTSPVPPVTRTILLVIIQWIKIRN